MMSAVVKTGLNNFLSTRLNFLNTILAFFFFLQMKMDHLHS